MMVTFLAAMVLSDKPSIAIKLESKSPIFRAGVPVAFRALATNTSGAQIMLIPQGDGAQSGRKYPLCQIQVRGNNGRWIAPKLGPGCGNTNPIREQDFVELKPGKAIDLLGGMAWSAYDLSEAFKSSGTYEEIGR